MVMHISLPILFWMKLEGWCFHCNFFILLNLSGIFTRIKTKICFEFSLTLHVCAGDSLEHCLHGAHIFYQIVDGFGYSYYGIKKPSNRFCGEPCVPSMGNPSNTLYDWQCECSGPKVLNKSTHCRYIARGVNNSEKSRTLFRKKSQKIPKNPEKSSKNP